MKRHPWINKDFRLDFRLQSVVVRTVFQELFVRFSRLKSVESTRCLKNTNVCKYSFYKLFL